MSNSDIRNEVKQFLIDTFFIDTSTVTLDSDTSFLENGIIDSTGILEVIGFIEDNYNIEVDDSEMLPENLDSLNNIANFVLKKQSN